MDRLKILQTMRERSRPKIDVGAADVMWEENLQSDIQTEKDDPNLKKVRWRDEPPPSPSPSPPPSRKKKWSLWNFFPYHRSRDSKKNIPLVRTPKTDKANKTTNIYGGKKSRRRRIRKSKKSRRKRGKSRRKSGKSRAKRRRTRR